MFLCKLLQPQWFLVKRGLVEQLCLQGQNSGFLPNNWFDLSTFWLARRRVRSLRGPCDFVGIADGVLGSRLIASGMASRRCLRLWMFAIYQ